MSEATRCRLPTSDGNQANTANDNFFFELVEGSKILLAISEKISQWRSASWRSMDFGGWSVLSNKVYRTSFRWKPLKNDTVSPHKYHQLHQNQKVRSNKSKADLYLMGMCHIVIQTKIYADLLDTHCYICHKALRENKEVWRWSTVQWNDEHSN